jgi:hypothetical protein
LKKLLKIPNIPSFWYYFRILKTPDICLKFSRFLKISKESRNSYKQLYWNDRKIPYFFQKFINYWDISKNSWKVHIFLKLLIFFKILRTSHKSEMSYTEGFMKRIGILENPEILLKFQKNSWFFQKFINYWDIPKNSWKFLIFLELLIFFKIPKTS